MRAAPQHTRKAQAPGRLQASKGQSPPKTIGRPKGPPAPIITLRIPLDLLDRLDRYLDHLESHTGLKANRGMLARRALALFLATRATSESEPGTQRSQR